MAGERVTYSPPREFRWHSDERRRDDQFDNRIMDVTHFPNAVFTLTSPVELASSPRVNSIVNETATGTLALHGVTKSLTFTFQGQYTGGAVKLSGSIPITFADWNIDNPSAGPAQVGASGTLGLLLVLSLSPYAKGYSAPTDEVRPAEMLDGVSSARGVMPVAVRANRLRRERMYWLIASEDASLITHCAAHPQEAPNVHPSSPQPAERPYAS